MPLKKLIVLQPYKNTWSMLLAKPEQGGHNELAIKRTELNKAHE